MIARGTSGNVFDHLDALGSVRATTGSAGNAGEDLLFYPFGLTWAAQLGGDGYDMNFASMPHNDWVANGVTSFRFYNHRQGRWLSPDPLGGDVTNPQSLNRYAYVLNNPCSLTDPLGLDPCSFNIAINNSGLISQSQLNTLQRTLSGIFSPAGVGVNFNFSGAADYTLAVTGTAAVANPNDPGAAPQLVSGVLGPTVPGPNDTVGNVGFVLPGLVSAWYNLYDPSTLAVALGRAAAHEAGHSLLQIGPQHAGVPFYSIMTAAPNLLDPSLAFSQGEAIQLQYKCNKLHPPSNNPKPVGGGPGGGGVGPSPVYPGVFVPLGSGGCGEGGCYYITGYYIGWPGNPHPGQYK